MFKQFINLLFSKKEIHDERLSETPEECLHDEEKNLINFLKNNSQPSTDIKNEIFRVQNLLNEVYGLIEPTIQQNNVEFIYDIDESVPIELVGDPLILEQVLYNLLAYILKKSNANTLIVKFQKDSEKLYISILGNAPMLETDTKDNLSTNIGITQELIEKMHGTLSIKQDYLQTLYSLTLPLLHHELYQESYYQLPSHIKGKKVLLIEDLPESKKIIQKIFTQFQLEITIENSDTLPSLQNFDTYDILIVDAKKITPLLMRHLQEIKEENGLKIISLETLFGWQKDRRLKPSALINKYLYKPLSRGMVSGLLYELFVLKTDENIVIDEESNYQKLQPSGEVVFIEEAYNITRESFKDFGQKHILIVEDNEINQRIMQSVLEKSDIKLSFASNGQEALDCLENDHSVNMILMDINMPTMDGYQATKEIRKNHRLNTLPIIIISGLGFRNEIEQMYLVGADAHLTKPFKVGQLYTAFKMFLEKQNILDRTSKPTIHYSENREILDIKTATYKMHNILMYRDTLREVLVRLKYSDHIIKERIIRKEFNELQSYCTDLLLDSKSIEAKSLSNVLREILILLKNNEVELLQQYISLYHEEWIKTKRSIAHYLKSVNA